MIRRAHSPTLGRDSPILNRKAGHPRKHAYVMCDDGHLFRKSNRRNQKIIGTNRGACPIQFSTNSPVPFGGSVPKRNGSEFREQLGQRLKIHVTAGTVHGTEIKLRLHN